jgi:hypothetical protein
MGAQHRKRMAWWLNRTGQPEGPYEDAHILQMIGSGQLRGGNICQAGHNAWMPIEQHPVFGAALRGGPAPHVYAPVAQPRKKSSAGLVIGVVIGAVVLLGGGAFLVLNMPRKGTAASLDPKEAQKRVKAFEATLPTLKKIGSLEFPIVEDKYTEKVPTPNFSGDSNEDQLIMYKTDFPEADLEDGKILFRASNAKAARCLKELEEWKKKKGSKETVTEYFLQGCTKLEYLFVIDVTSVKEPSVAGKEGGVVNFEEGRVEGNVFAFSLKSGKPLGGYKFAAKSSDRLEKVPGSDDADRVLRDDLMTQLQRELAAGHTRASSGS